MRWQPDATDRCNAHIRRAGTITHWGRYRPRIVLRAETIRDTQTHLGLSPPSVLLTLIQALAASVRSRTNPKLGLLSYLTTGR